MADFAEQILKLLVFKNCNIGFYHAIELNETIIIHIWIILLWYDVKICVDLKMYLIEFHKLCTNISNLPSVQFASFDFHIL